MIKRNKVKKKVLNPNYAHWFVFVFDASEPQSELTTKQYLEAFERTEAMENQSVLASDSNQDKAIRVVWANKCDMEWAEIAKTKGNFFIWVILDPEWKRVSAMSSKDIKQIFKELVKNVYEYDSNSWNNSYCLSMVS